MSNELVGEQGKVIAFIDLGSNSVRLMLVRVKSNASYVIINQLKYMVRLGEDSFQKHLLKESAIERTIYVLHSFAQMCDSYNVSETIALATSAVRDARNGQDFIDRCYTQTGIKFTIISGAEEARLIYIGINSELDHNLHLRLFMDIGGGSTELIVANSLEYKYLESLELGCVRLTNRFFKDEARAISNKDFNKIMDYVKQVAIRSIGQIKEYPVTHCYGSSGTIENLAEINEFYNKTDSANTNEDYNEVHCLSYLDLCKLSKKLCAFTLEERRNIPVINTNRAEVIVAGAAILQALMQELNIEKIIVSKRTLQNGMLMDYLMRNYAENFHFNSSAREQSTLQLARFCRCEEKHFVHVAKIALELFDNAKQLKLHDYDLADRELLYYASILHDVGVFISYVNHNAHSHYLIENTEMLGFSRQEINIMAALAFFHRKKASKKYHIFNNFSEPKQEMIIMLSLFLTLAERMDRTHRQVITNAKFIRRDKALVLQLSSYESCPIELDYLDRTKKQISKVLNSTIYIEQVQGLTDNF